MCEWSLIEWHRLALGSGGIQRALGLVLRIRADCDCVFIFFGGNGAYGVILSGDMFFDYLAHGQLGYRL